MYGKTARKWPQYSHWDKVIGFKTIRILICVGCRKAVIWRGRVKSS